MLKLRSSKYLLVSKLRTKFQLTVIILSSAVYNLSECFYTTSRVGKTECPTNTPRGFHVETTWKQSLPCRFKVESTWCVCRVGTCLQIGIPYTHCAINFVCVVLMSIVVETVFWRYLENDLPHWLPMRQHQISQAENVTSKMSAPENCPFSNISRIDLINTCVVNSFADAI